MMDQDQEVIIETSGVIKKEMVLDPATHRTQAMADTRKNRIISHQVGLTLISISNKIPRRMMIKIEIEARDMMIVMTTIGSLLDQNLILTIIKVQKEMKIVEKDLDQDHVEIQQNLTLVSMKETLSQSLINWGSHH